MNKVNMIFFFLESTVVSPEEKAKENERKDYAAQWYVVTFMKKPFDGNGKCFMKPPREAYPSSEQGWKKWRTTAPMVLEIFSCLQKE